MNTHRRHLLLCMALPWAAASCSDDPKNCLDGYARDNMDRCQPIESDTGQSTNTPPTAPAVSLQPTAPRERGNPLVCRIASESVDTDGDPVSYEITWTLNDTAVESNSETDRPGDTVLSDRLTQGDTWTCEVRASDGISTGPAALASATIGPPPTLWESDTISLSEADHILTGETAGYCAGSALASAGDMDMDGRMDFLIGDTWWSHPETGAFAGKVYLVLGGDLGDNPLISLADAAWAFEGEEGATDDDPDCDGSSSRCGGDWGGHSTSGGMDGDGDGVPDILVSAYRSDERSMNQGKIAFFSGADLGSPGTRSIGSADLQLHGEESGDKMGHSMNWAGDVTGDGLAEAITGSALHSGAGVRAGRVYLIPGQTFAEQGHLGINETGAIAWDGENAEDRLGQQTGRLGDIDGDGLDDVAVSAMRNQDNGIGPGDDEFRGSGKLYVLLGDDISAMEPGSVQSVADASTAWMGEHGGDAIGYSTTTVGDFDGDGLPDMTVGSYGYSSEATQAGKVYVMTAQDVAVGGTRSLSEASYGFVGEADFDWAGKSASGADDIDRDGRADLLIGSMGHSRDDAELAGRTYLILSASVLPGTHEVSDADAIFDGENAWDSAGSTTLGPGDVNGDGLPDLLFGAWQGDSHEAATGRVYVFLNP